MQPRNPASAVGRLLLFGVLAIALTAAGTARAGTGGGDPLGDVPALSEYMEDVPTASGSKPTSTPKEKQTPSRSGHVSRRVARKIATQPAPVAQTLQKITSSPNYGAPKSAAPHERHRVRTALRNQSDAAEASSGEALGTAVSVATTGGDWHLTVLLVIVLLTTAAAIVRAAFRALPTKGR